jgi:uncharacterized membrane protein YkoI
MAMRKTVLQLSLYTALLLAASGLQAQTLSEASRQAARQYNAEVISAKTVQQNGRKVHVIKLLTRDGVVKTVRVPVREKQKKG